MTCLNPNLSARAKSAFCRFLSDPAPALAPAFAFAPALAPAPDPTPVPTPAPVLGYLKRFLTQHRKKTLLRIFN